MNRLLNLFLPTISWLIIGCGLNISPLSEQGQKLSLEQATAHLAQFGGRADLLPFCEEIRHQKGNNHLACKRQNSWGLISQEGRLLIKPQCEKLSQFNNYSGRGLSGSYLCEIKGKFALFGPNGNSWAAPEYTGFEQGHGFKKKVIITLNNQKMGLLIPGGEIVLPAEYDLFDCNAFYTGRFTKDDQVCLIKQGAKMGLVRTNGQLIFKAECDKVEIGGLINNWTYKCIKGPNAHYYSHKMELLRVAPTADDLAGNYRRHNL